MKYIIKFSIVGKLPYYREGKEGCQRTTDKIKLAKKFKTFEEADHYAYILNYGYDNYYEIIPTN